LSFQVLLILRFVKQMSSINRFFTWRGSYIWPYESLISILSKLTILNICSLKKLWKSNGFDFALSKYKYPKELTFLCKSYITVSRKTLHYSILYPYLKKHEEKILRSEKIRYCLDCIRSQYHSEIHQLLLFDKCPIHNTNLSSTCCHCGEDLGKYKIDFSSVGAGLRCHSCKQLLYTIGISDQIKLTDQHQKAKIEAGIINTVDWLRKRRKMLGSSTSSHAEYQGIKLKETAKSHLSNFHSYFNPILNFPKSTNNSKFSHHNGVSNGGIIFEHGTTILPTVSDSDLSTVYKSIRRRLFNIHIKRKHSVCYNEVTRKIRLAVSARSFNNVRICPIVYAYILWRMDIEKIDRLGGLEICHARVGRSGKFPPIISPDSWDIYSMWISRRVFALYCVGLFNAYVDYAFKASHLKKIIFDKNFIDIDTSSILPYFVFEKDHKKRPKSINWWRHKFIDLIDKPIHHNDICYRDELDQNIESILFQIIG